MGLCVFPFLRKKKETWLSRLRRNPGGAEPHGSKISSFVCVKLSVVCSIRKLRAERSSSAELFVKQRGDVTAGSAERTRFAWNNAFDLLMPERLVDFSQRYLVSGGKRGAVRLLADPAPRGLRAGAGRKRLFAGGGCALRLRAPAFFVVLPPVLLLPSEPSRGRRAGSGSAVRRSCEHRRARRSVGHGPDSVRGRGVRALSLAGRV